MIAMVSGKVIYRGNGFAIVERDGIGYKVNLPEPVGVSGDVSLYTHEVIREDQRELFGFFSIEALELFWRLTSVSGVGPKSGQKIVFAASVDEVKRKIMTQDIAFLSSISGIGKKTAQKIVLDLSGVLAEADDVAKGAEGEAVDALVGLGYTRKQASDALEGLDGSVEDQIRQALKRLSR